MNQNSIYCIPGPWSDRSELLKAIVGSSKGDYFFAGGVLANPTRKEHYQLDFCEADPNMLQAFELAGQGKLTEETCSEIAKHKGIAYLISPLHIIEEKEKLCSFLEALKNAGGIALKIESSGVAHEWEHWSECMTSELPFDLYRAFVMLIGDQNVFYSCGMHHFNLPDVEIPSNIGIERGAELINKFNLYNFTEEPKLSSGHTFSLSEDSEIFRLKEIEDTRHSPDDLFHNTKGLWRLNEAELEDNPRLKNETDSTESEREKNEKDVAQKFCKQCGRNANLSPKIKSWNEHEFCNSLCLSDYKKKKGIRQEKSTKKPTEKKKGFFRGLFN